MIVHCKQESSIGVWGDACVGDVWISTELCDAAAKLMVLMSV